MIVIRMVMLVVILDSVGGANIERLIRNGQLVPDDLTLKAIRRTIDNSGSRKFLLDGYPRTMYLMHIPGTDSRFNEAPLM